MPDERLPKKVFCGELQEGKHSQCDKRNRYKDNLKDSLKVTIFILSPGNRLHRIKENGLALSGKHQLSIKKAESAKLKESAKNAKPEPLSEWLKSK